MYKPEQEPMAGEVIDLYGEATSLVLLHGFDVSVKLPSKECLCLRITIVISFNSQLLVKCREQVTGTMVWWPIS